MSVRKPAAISVLLLVALLIFAGGCTTSRVWDGKSNGATRERTVNIIPASTDNVYLSCDSIIAIPYKLSSSQGVSADEKILSPYTEGHFFGQGGEETFGHYKHQYSYAILYQILNGPIDLRINAVSLAFAANYKANYNMSWMEKKLEEIQYLRYRPKKPEDFDIPHGEIIRDYFLDIDVAFTAPDNFIQVETTAASFEVNQQIDSDNGSRILLYYRFAEQFIYPRSGDYSKDKEHIDAALTVQPVGWLLANGQVIASVSDAGASRITGVVIMLRGKDSSFKRIKLTFNGPDSKESTLHYKARISYGTDHGLQASRGKYNSLLRQNVTVNGMKLLFNTPHNYPLTFEIHDDITERTTLPMPVKILLTPITVIADIVLTPLYAGVSYIMEGMPR